VNLRQILIYAIETDQKDTLTWLLPSMTKIPEVRYSYYCSCCYLEIYFSSSHFYRSFRPHQLLWKKKHILLRVKANEGGKHCIAETAANHKQSMQTIRRIWTQVVQRRTTCKKRN